MEAIKEKVEKGVTQMVMIIMPNVRADTYSAVKQLTLVNLGIPSQVKNGSC